MHRKNPSHLALFLISVLQTIMLLFQSEKLPQATQCVSELSKCIKLNDFGHFYKPFWSMEWFISESVVSSPDKKNFVGTAVLHKGNIKNIHSWIGHYYVLIVPGITKSRLDVDLTKSMIKLAKIFNNHTCDRDV